MAAFGGEYLPRVQRAQFRRRAGACRGTRFPRLPARADRAGQGAGFEVPGRGELLELWRALREISLRYEASAGRAPDCGREVRLGQAEAGERLGYGRRG